LESEYIARRVMQLREYKGISQGNMSESMGLSTGYITKLESGHNLPSMTAFLKICKYFHITPKEFFDEGIADPGQHRGIIANLRKLDYEQTDLVDKMIKALLKNSSDDDIL